MKDSVGSIFDVTQKSKRVLYIHCLFDINLFPAGITLSGLVSDLEPQVPDLLHHSTNFGLQVHLDLQSLAHDLLFEVYVLFDLQTLFFNVYFVTIIYYYGDRIIKKAYRDNFKIPFTILRTVYGALLLGHVVLFFYSVFTTSDKCVGKVCLTQIYGT